MWSRVAKALVMLVLLLLVTMGARYFLVRDDLVGKWQTADGRQTYEFLSDGEVLIDGKHGDGWADKNAYTYDGSTLLITTSARFAYTVSMNGNELILTPISSGGGFPQTFFRSRK